jgi:chromosome segregation ATPase
MQKSIKERVAKLREEIAQINQANRQYQREGKKFSPAVSDHERRSERLQEILSELASLTDWRKV